MFFMISCFCSGVSLGFLPTLPEAVPFMMHSRVEMRFSMLSICFRRFSNSSICLCPFICVQYCSKIKVNYFAFRSELSKNKNEYPAFCLLLYRNKIERSNRLFWIMA